MLAALGGGLEKGAWTSLLANGDGAMLGLSVPGLPVTPCTTGAGICAYLIHTQHLCNMSQPPDQQRYRPKRNDLKSSWIVGQAELQSAAFLLAGGASTAQSVMRPGLSYAAVPVNEGCGREYVRDYLLLSAGEW